MRTLKRNYTNELTYKIETEKELTVAKVGVGSITGRDSQGVWDGHVHTFVFKVDNQQGLYSIGNSAQCYVADWMGGEFGGEWVYVYIFIYG